MGDQMRPTPRVVLSQTAPWAPPRGASHRLHNSYRDRFTEVGGRKFKVSASGMNTVWDIEEIDTNGELLVVEWRRDEQGRPEPVLGYVGVAFTLAQARRLIAAEVARGAQ